MAQEIENAIIENVTGPAEAHGDSGGMTQHDPTKVIEADRYLESKKASRKRGLGIKLTKLVSPGTD